MNFFKNLDQKWIPYTVASCSAVVLYVAITHFHTIYDVVNTIIGFAFPILLGIAIAYILNPMVSFLQKTMFRKMRSGRNIAIAMTLILICIFAVLLMSALIPQLVTSILGFIDNMDGYINRFLSLINSVGFSLEDRVDGLELDMTAVTNTSASILGTIATYLRENINQVLSRSTSIGSSIFTWIIAIILSVYFLTDRDRIVGGLKRLMKLLIPEEKHEATRVFFYRCNNIIAKYVVFELIDALIVGSVNFVFMTIASIPYSVLISVVVGVTNLAPTFGPIVGGVIGSFILLLANPWNALSFLIFTIILQTIDGYVIKPKMFGGTLGVSSVVILACIIIGGRMFSVWGVLLAIPAAAIMDFIYHDICLTALEKRRELRKNNTL